MAGIVLAQVRWDDLTDPSADTAITTHHYEVPITPPGAADATAFVTAFDSFFSVVSNKITSDLAANEIRFYSISPTPGTPSGEPFDIRIGSRVGGSADSRLPPQVAISITEETLARRRWGRFYVPGLTAASLGPNGRILSTVVAQFADAAELLGESLRTSGRELAVLRQVDRTYQLVHGIRVDNTWDIIRRRRMSTTTVRELRNLLV
jgi:hypothetical protein